MPASPKWMIWLTIVLALCACENDRRCIPAAPENWGSPPIIEVQTDTCCILGDTLRLQAIATDPDGDNLTFLATALLRDQSELDYVADSFMDAATGEFWFAPNLADMPYRSFLFTAVDERQFSATTKFDVAVDFYVDQANMSGNGGVNILLYAPLGQEFVPDLSSLDIVQVHIRDGRAETNFRMSVRQGTIMGPILGVSNILTCPVGFDGVASFEFERISLQVGELYVFRVVQLSPGGWVIETGDDNYPRGRMVTEGQPGGRDLWFRLGAIWPPPPEATGVECASRPAPQ